MFLVTLSHSSPPQCHNFCHVLHFYNIGPCSHSLRRDGCCKMLMFYFLGSQFTAPCLYCLNCFNTDEESPTMSLATGFWLAKRLLRSFSLVTDTIQAAKWLTSAPYLVSTPPRERKLAPRWCWSMCLLCVTWPHAPHGHRVHHPLWRRVTQYPGLCTLKYAGGRESNIVRIDCRPSALPIILTLHFGNCLGSMSKISSWDGSCAGEMRTLSARITKPDWIVA